mmetsp:Transcript_10619/g.22684  ORF Transcript_10619/g.22684 Transcript_10619/m.22684 type:complete len:98 (+) Transcript_10619:407-700(+)
MLEAHSVTGAKLGTEADALAGAKLGTETSTLAKVGTGAASGTGSGYADRGLALSSSGNEGRYASIASNESITISSLLGMASIEMGSDFSVIGTNPLN